MCGIFGLVQRAPILGEQLARMSGLLRHRGPDDEGLLVWTGDVTHVLAGKDTPINAAGPRLPYTPRRLLAHADVFETGGVALGHRRLSIIDLSRRGHQPMSRGDRYWITYNGEIYNYVELRRELQQLGECFTSTSDTEVILAAYSQWGPGCLARFNGMWAFAILDTHAGTVFLSRDRFGVKPLYLLRTEHGVAFASEIKAFQAIDGWRGRMNMDRVLDFLVWNVSDHTSETMFAGVEQLPAGHFATIDTADLWSHGAPHGDNARPRRWYSLPAPTTRTRTDWNDEVRHTLNDAVRLRLRADVAVGSCLSGGIDSSTIVCLMSRELAQSNGSHRVRTFTACSDEAAFDESAFARTVVDSAGADAHFVTPTVDGLFDEMDSLIWHQDEPFGTTSIFAQRCVFQAARQCGVIVMLDGQGADELLGGYRGYFGARLGGFVRAGSLASWVKEIGATHRATGIGVPRLVGYSAAYALPSLTRLLGRFDNRAYGDHGWIHPSKRGAFASDPIARAGGRPHSISDMSRAQLTSTHLPMLLRWEDRNSMAFSVEARVPFLDYRFAELCLRLPDEAKVAGGVTKKVLRSSMRGTVPDRVLDRRDKMGFVTAEEAWTVRSASDRFQQRLSGAVDRLNGIVDRRLLHDFSDVVAGRRAFDHRYWRALCLGAWANRFDLA